MSVKVVFECDGCFKIANGNSRIKRTFISVTGRSTGIGSYKIDKISDVLPDGWIDFDPYTSCTYCKDCWDEIEKGDCK